MCHDPSMSMATGTLHAVPEIKQIARRHTGVYCMAFCTLVHQLSLLNLLLWNFICLCRASEPVSEFVDTLRYNLSRPEYRGKGRDTPTTKRAKHDGMTAFAASTIRNTRRLNLEDSSGVIAYTLSGTRIRALSSLGPSLPSAESTRKGTSLSSPSTVNLLERGRCRPTERVPLRIVISKPSAVDHIGLSTGRKIAWSNSLTSGTERQRKTTPTEVMIDCGGRRGDGSNGMASRFMWLDSVNSTMDEVKSLIVNKREEVTGSVVAVAAQEQLRGRGTKGRKWQGLAGNVFLTVAIPLDRVPVPMSLIPLRVGTLIAPEIRRRLRHPPPSSAHDDEKNASEVDSTNSRVSLKWPNDVLLGGGKVAGVLIEAELPFLLIGIGVNMRQKPDVPQEGSDRGRPAACLGDFGADVTDEAVRDLSAALTRSICSWASSEDSATSALDDWSQWVDWSMPLEIRDERRAVRPLGVASDGRLRVADLATGREEVLTTEYLF